jgi:hypothetical protein
MSRFETTESTGFISYPTSKIENKITNLVQKLEPRHGVEFLVGALASVCSEDQLKAFAMHLEERATK